VIVLDTNVISELTRSHPEPRVLAWLNACDPDVLTTSAITAAELCFGIALLPDGRRKDELQAAVFEILDEELGVEPFDEAAARAYADPAAQRRRTGKPVALADGQIAAICLSLGATLATRNINDFAGFGIDLINPWEFMGQ
jgi:predicted nucleic acid-binding protein